MNIHTVYEPFLRHFRTRRMAQFVQLFRPSSNTRILDVGGAKYNWTLIAEEPQVTMVNIDAIPSVEGRFAMEVGDARALRFADNDFDIVYSNSVIEHVGSWEDQKKCAEEMRRLAPRYYVQTPYRWFFIEPHLITPFIHFLPKAWARPLMRNFTVHGLITRPSRASTDAFLDQTRLLTVREMRALFPDARIIRERFLGMTKSVIAVRH